MQPKTPLDFRAPDFHAVSVSVSSLEAPALLETQPCLPFRINQFNLHLRQLRQEAANLRWLQYKISALVPPTCHNKVNADIKHI